MCADDHNDNDGKNGSNHNNYRKQRFSYFDRRDEDKIHDQGSFPAGVRNFGFDVSWTLRSRAGGATELLAGSLAGSPS